MRDVIEKMLLTLVFYVLDILIWGSIFGLIYVLGYYTSNIFFETDHDLTISYFKGLAAYWLIDTILAKFRETYRMVSEVKRSNK